jgi:hypothetical protein
MGHAMRCFDSPRSLVLAGLYTLQFLIVDVSNQN